jgi:hypothetical protein
MSCHVKLTAEMKLFIDDKYFVKIGLSKGKLMEMLRVKQPGLAGHDVVQQ